MEATRSWSLATSDVPRELIAAFESALAPRLEGASFAECEAAAMALQDALVRAYLQRELARREAAFGAEVSVDGRRYRRHQPGTRTYHSLCGALLVERHTYRLLGVHNGPTLVPLELSAGLLESATPAFAYAVVQGYAAMPLRSFEAELRAAHREPPSRSTMERVAKRVGAGLAPALPELEPLPAAATAPDAAMISLGIDRTCAPMAEARAADASPAPRRPRTQPYRRQPPEPFDVNYRMPYVGTIAQHDRHGDVVSTIRIAATAGEGPELVIQRLFDEALAAQRAHPRAPLVIVQDGAPELWSLVGDACRARRVRPTFEMIDRYHLDERLAATAEAICGTQCGEPLRRRWKHQLDRSDTAILRIRRELRALWWYFLDPYENPIPRSLARFIEHHIPDGRRRIIEQNLGYLENHHRRMRYASAIRRGAPIGSGITEGACKSVVGMRCKRSGQR